MGTAPPRAYRAHAHSGAERLTAMRQIFVDTETTGLEPGLGHRVVEIGCIEMVNRRLSGRDLHFYLNPERRSHEDALKVHGLTDEFLADKPLFAHVVDELLEYVRGAEVIMHNAAFDAAFLSEELKRVGKPMFHTVVDKVTDSLMMARDLFPGKSNSLDALCKRFEVNNTGRTLHGALLDAGLLAEVYIRMTRGQETLVIDAHRRADGEAALPRADLSVLALRVVAASDDELAAHMALIAEVDKASAGRTVWRQQFA